VVSRDFTETSTSPKSRFIVVARSHPGRVTAGNVAVAIAIAMIPIRAKSGRHSDPETEQR